MLNISILSVLLWLPIIGGFSLLLIRNEQSVRLTALLYTVLVFLLTLGLYIGFDLTAPGFQFVERYQWISAGTSFKVEYYLGVDGVSVAFLLLNAFITPLVVLAAWESVKKRVAQYLATFLIMQGIVNGVFMAQDALLFFIFFEAMLIPLFLVIGVWGGQNRVYATIKFFLYTFLGSVFLLITLIYLQRNAGSFEIEAFATHLVSKDKQLLIFFALLFAIGVKIPMIPVHTWLPDAHVEAPTGGSVILAAITLKVGGYAFLKLLLPVAPVPLSEYAWLPMTLSIAAIIYIGLVALVQEDMKKLIAYSSIAHMGFVTLALFTAYAMYAMALNNTILLTTMLQGGIVQMISHGFISAALFLCVGMLYDRMHTREIAAYGGVANRMPTFAAFFVLFAMANAGLPGTSGFVGEFMIITSMAEHNFWIAATVAITLVIGAAYSLWLVRKVFYGEVENENVDKLQDINRREFSILTILAIAVLWLGLYPKPLLDLIEPPLNTLSARTAEKLTVLNGCTPEQHAEGKCPVGVPVIQEEAQP